MTVYGGFGVSGPISDQILSKSCLMGACLAEKMFLRDFITHEIR